MNLFSVSDNGDGTYKLLDGAHRLTALRIVAERTGTQATAEVSAQIHEQMDDDDILMRQIAGNITITKTTNPEYIKALYKITVHEDPTKRLTLDQLAKKTSMSREYLFKLFTTIRLPEDVQKMISDGSMTIANAIRLSDLVGKVSDEEFESFILDAQNDTNAEFTPKVEAAIQAVRANKKPAQTEFLPVAKLLDKGTLQARLAAATTTFNQNPSVENEVRLNTLKEIFSLDEKSVAKQKADWDTAQVKKEDAKKARENKRNSDKLNELAQQLGVTIQPQAK